jgi:hypothetical protein
MPAYNTDDGVMALAGIRRINLTDTKTTDKAVECLAKAGAWILSVRRIPTLLRDYACLQPTDYWPKASIFDKV